MSRDRGGQRHRRRIRAQVQDLETGLNEDIGDHRNTQAMPLPGRHRDQDRAAVSAAATEPRSHASDDRGRHATCEVLLFDADLTALPGGPDTVECRREDVDVYVRGLDAGGHRRLDDLPGAFAVTCQHAPSEALGPGCPSPRGRRGGGSRQSRGAGCPMGDRRHWEVGRVDAPGATNLARRQHPEPNAAIDRHVVDAEAVGRLVEGQGLDRVRGHRLYTTRSSCHAGKVGNPAST